MSYYCEMCSREVDGRSAKKIIIEGSTLIVCPICYSKLIKQRNVREVEEKPRSKTSIKKPQTPPPTKPSMMLGELLEIAENYASRIKSAREKLGWTQDVLAQKVGESVNTIKRIESGRLKPSIELARKLEKTLGIKILEPVVNELGEVSKHKEEYLTIGDLIRVEESQEKKKQG